MYFFTMKGEFCRIPYRQREKHFVGTGDLFSALLLGRFMQEKDFFSAGMWAVEKIGGFIDAYEEDGLSEKGIPMERYLTLLKE